MRNTREEELRLAFATRRKIRRRRIIKRRIFAALITVFFTASVIFAGLFAYRLLFPPEYDNGFVPAPYGKNVSEKVIKAEKIEMPSWVDKQIINIHSTARTGKKLKDIKNIVIHYVGNPNSTAQNNRDYFNKVTTSVSSHFVVGLEGEIIQCVPLYEKSAASNERNKDTISIEVCHPDESGEFNEKTYESLIKLTAWLCNEFDLDENDIIRHYDVTGKICPKYYVENAEAWEQMQEDIGKKIDEY